METGITQSAIMQGREIRERQAIRELSDPTLPAPGDLYRHWQGGMVQIESVALNDGDYSSVVVLYRKVVSPWVEPVLRARTLSSFLKTLDFTSGNFPNLNPNPSVKSGPRYSLIEKGIRRAGTFPVAV